MKFIFFRKSLFLNGQVLDLKSSVMINFISKQLPMLSEDTDIIGARIERAAIKLSLSNPPICPVAYQDEFLNSSGTEILLREYSPLNSKYNKTMLFFHGGGHVFGGKETHHDFLMYFSSILRLKIFALDYRLAPEFPFPADLNDAELALDHLQKIKGIHIDDIFLCGDSAGGGLAASLTTKLITDNAPYPKYQCLIYPMLDPSCSSKTMSEYAEGFYLTKKSMNFFWEKYQSNEIDLNNPCFNLMLSSQTVSHYPVTHIVTAGFDPLSGEAELFSLNMYKKGFNITQSHYPNMFHAFINFNKIPACGAALNDIAMTIRGWCE